MIIAYLHTVFTLYPVVNLNKLSLNIFCGEKLVKHCLGIQANFWLQLVKSFLADQSENTGNVHAVLKNRKKFL